MGLKVEKVNKHFGEKLAVDNISFEMDKPGVFGLLGTNGAGKTTTIRMMLGIIKKDSGELKGMKKEEACKEIDYWMNRLKVEEYKDMQAEKLSKGNQQKIQFITSILHNPELIVLDEPFSGLDPVNTELLKGVILELVEKGKYIIMSSHQMTSIEEFCSDVVIINKGKTVLKGNLKEIKNSYPAKSLEIIVNQDITSYVEELGMEIEKNIDNNYEINIENEEQAHTLMKNLVKNDISIEKFELKKPSLNDIFIEKVGA